VLYILPTFFSNSLPSWYNDIFDKKVNLGLDLQGGIHLVFGVEVDKALEDKADQYVSDFKETLREKRILFKKISRVDGTWDMKFELEDPADANKFRKRVLKTYYNLKEVKLDEEQPGVIKATFDDNYVKELRKNARDQAKITIRNRVDELGVTLPDIAAHGEEGILVQLPGIFEPERAKALLGRTAQLEFKLVDDKSDFMKKLRLDLPKDITIDSHTYSGPNEETVTEWFLLSKGKGTEGRNRLLDFFNNTAEIDSFLSEKKVEEKIHKKIVELASAGISEEERKEIKELALAALGQNDDPNSAAIAKLNELLKGKVPEGREIGFGRNESQLEIEYRTYYLHSQVSLTGDYITDASVQPDAETGQPGVSLNFDRTGAKKFEKLTGAHVKERMAIVLEGEVSSAPTIQDRIGGGRARITLGATRDYNEALTEAQDLAMVLRAGALPAPIKIMEERTVGPTMGEDARRQGSYALALGMVLVVIFMLIYYKISGIVANMALIINAIFILAAMVIAGATLTLPGIAAIILTVGMAVDANVIINERIREELRAGKTPRAAVDSGYGHAFWTIFDANFTTLIAAAVLWSYGSGPIKGFAVTLIIGVCCTMFTAIFITRLIMDYLTIRLRLQKLSV
jgi:preprotein translocase subunit SecD